MVRPPQVDDPLTFALRPPPNESEIDRLNRIKREQEAKRISDRIDSELRLEGERLKRRKSKGEAKLLLLGQAESGKSTLQKQFQLLYAPNSLHRERLSWRTVVYYNIIKTIAMILETLEYYEMQERQDANDEDDEVTSQQQRQQLRELRMRLSPLTHLEQGLISRLTGSSVISSPGSARPEVFVRRGWQSNVRAMSPKGRRNDWSADGDDPSEPIARILSACREDVKALWSHELVGQLLKSRRLKLAEHADFFLSDFDRIAQTEYIPSIDDILHARLRTIGVVEHSFDVVIAGQTIPWLLYDVGGAKGQRHTWVPFFDDATAIIFLAPISAFDQYLEEDPRTNRIDDSLQTFTQICSNKLLKSSHLVLFLNKTDVLKAKLRMGVRVKKFITSFGSRPNDFDEVSQYFRAHFQQVHRRNSKETKRSLYVHLTSVVDTETTQQIIGSVRDSIFRGYLKQAALV